MNYDNIYNLIISAYPNSKCELNYNNPYQLLIAVILSAQCTDKRVNEVTQCLFKAIQAPSDAIKLGVEEISKQIFSCGFYRSKAVNIVSVSLDIINKHNGNVPSNLEDLIKLKGVGRKTANVILSEVFNVNAIAVDTHVLRTSQRLGLSKNNTPDKVENDLTTIFKGKNLKALHHALIFHGRYCCKSQNPNCKECPLISICVKKPKM